MHDFYLSIFTLLYWYFYLSKEPFTPLVVGQYGFKYSSYSENTPGKLKNLKDYYTPFLEEWKGSVFFLPPR